MASTIINTPTVQALYSYKGAHNDELTFKKGDIITLTQKVEGGWWEGTLGDTTGWFPANYVKEHNEPVQMPRGIEDSQACRLIVAKDLHDSEKAHLTELQGLYTNFLLPLESSEILTSDEFKQLIGNIRDIILIHEKLLSEIQRPSSVNSLYSDRIGKVFLEIASKFKSVHMAYCANHPRAVIIIDKYKDELNVFMERSGASSPGILVLITGLSKPFRRLHKYSAMLQELERHMELSHPDRGDTQRGVAVYKDIDNVCSATRKQKELQLQVLTGPVRGWQGQPVSSLGDILHMSCVSVGTDQKDRFLVLFPTTLLILSVSQRMSAFIYEGKLPLAGIVVRRLEDSDLYKNVFEITGPLIEKIIVICKTSDEADRWVELLSERRSSTKSIPSSNPSISVSPKPPHAPLTTSQSSSSRGFVPADPDLPVYHKRSHSFNHHQSFIHHTNNNKPPSSNQNKKSSGWKMINLRPKPPLCLTNPARQQSRCTYEEDAQILRVIEAYYAPSKNSNNNLPAKAVDLDLIPDGKVNVFPDYVYNNQRRGQSFNNHQRVFNLNKASRSNTTNDIMQVINNASTSSVRFSPNTRFYNGSDAMPVYKGRRTPNVTYKSNPTLNKRDLSFKSDTLYRSNPTLNDPSPDYCFSQRRHSFRNEAYHTKRSSSWCCGSFVKKQLKKTKHYD